MQLCKTYFAEAQHMILTSKHAEKQNVGTKIQIKEMKEEIQRIQGTHERHLKEKKEMWTICSVCTVVRGYSSESTL